MSAAPPSVESLQATWVAAWPAALAAWSRHVKLRPPTLCLTDAAAQIEGLTDSFAMIRLHDQSVIINLAAIACAGLESFAVEILAHEIGHHVLAPANLTDHVLAIARIRKALPTFEVHAPMIANLYTDLMINDRLQRAGNLRMAQVFERLNATEEAKEGHDSLWWIYLRAYEQLWSLPRGTLTRRKPPDDVAEGDAWLAMRIVRHYARDWLEGAARFATLFVPYLAQDAQLDRARVWYDTRAAGAGGEPAVPPESLVTDGPIVHPAFDPEITGTLATQDTEDTSGSHPRDVPRAGGGGQQLEPFEYGEILRSAGVTLNNHEMAVRYYRDKALPHLIAFPRRPLPSVLDAIPEGIEPWNIGEPFDTVDWLQSVLVSPHVVPGMTTVQRLWGLEDGAIPKSEPLDLDVYIDSSGSMANPQVELSYPALAGTILCLSALRAGARVKVTVWSGKRQVTSTPGFVRDAQGVMRILMSHYGGGTQFPLGTLRATYLDTDEHTATRRHTTHLLVISDDGVTTLFNEDERGTAGWEITRRVLLAAGGGATFVLNVSPHWATMSFAFDHRDMLVRARDELGIQIYTISDWNELVKFAREFARRVYVSLPQARLPDIRHVP